MPNWTDDNGVSHYNCKKSCCNPDADNATRRSGGRYVEVPSDQLFAKLEAAGFTRGIMGREVTYTRKHDRDPRLSVVVYTSITEGAQDARGCGEDAIRVGAAFSWVHRPTNELRRKNLYKARVYRVTSIEGVLTRTMDKAREAYAACNEWLKTQNQNRKEAHNV